MITLGVSECTITGPHLDLWNSLVSRKCPIEYLREVLPHNESINKALDYFLSADQRTILQMHYGLIDGQPLPFGAISNQNPALGYTYAIRQSVSTAKAVLREHIRNALQNNRTLQEQIDYEENQRDLRRKAEEIKKAEAKRKKRKKLPSNQVKKDRPLTPTEYRKERIAVCYSRLSKRVTRTDEELLSQDDIDTLLELMSSTEKEVLEERHGLKNGLPTLWPHQRVESFQLRMSKQAAAEAALDKLRSVYSQLEDGT